MASRGLIARSATMRPAQGGIAFAREKGGRGVELTILTRHRGDRHWHVPNMSAFTAEGELQTMLRDAPELLLGDDERRPIVMADEFPVSVGSVDLVGVSPTGWLTVVECKLKANPEIRRSIVGQLFAYGSALWGMPYEDFGARYA